MVIQGLGGVSPAVSGYRFETDALFIQVVAAAGVSSIRFHDMRRTFVSLMLAAGGPHFKVSVWLGHSDIRVTQQVYAHWTLCDPRIDLLQVADRGGPVPDWGPVWGPMPSATEDPDPCVDAS